MNPQAQSWTRPGNCRSNRATRRSALAGRKTQTFGAIFPEIASGFYADVLAGIDEVAAENGFEVLASFVGTRRSRPELIKRLLRQGRVDAIILLNLNDESNDLDPDAWTNCPSS